MLCRPLDAKGVHCEFAKLVGIAFAGFCEGDYSLGIDCSHETGRFALKGRGYCPCHSRYFVQSRIRLSNAFPIAFDVLGVKGCVFEKRRSAFPPQRSLAA